MKSALFNIFFANLLSLNAMKGEAHLNLPGLGEDKPKGDTVVVRMKNKNKVIIITEKGKDLGSFKSINLNQIVSEIDSSFKSISLENGGELDMRVITGDSVMRIRLNKPGSNSKNYYRAMVQIEDGPQDTIHRKAIIRKEVYTTGKTRKHRIDDLFELDLGWNNYFDANGSLPSDNNSDYGLNPLWSNYVALRGMKNLFWQPGSRRFSTSVGLEVAWNNYKYDGNVIIKKGTDGVAFEPFPEEQRKIKSKLTVTWLNLPVMMHYRAKNSSFHLAIGGFAGYRLSSHSKTKFELDGSTRKEHNYSNFYLNSLQYGARVQFGFYDVDFFAQYNFNTLFTKDRAMQLTPFSFGITL